MKTRLQLILLLSSFAAVATLSGCKAARAVVCGPKAYTISVNADAAFVANTSVKVDIIGVTDAELPEWRSRNADNYRSVADVYAMSFGQGLPREQALAIDNALWQSWTERNVTHVYIVALIPGMSADGLAGPADPRILELPLDRCLWAGKPDTLAVSLRGSGLRVESARK